MKQFNPNLHFSNRIAEGDESAFVELYNDFYESIYSFVLKYVASQALAQDLTQDVFLKVWEKKESFFGVQNLKSYVYKVARNHTLDFLKRASTSNEIFSEIRLHYKSAGKLVEDQFQEKEYFDFLQKTLRNLPQRSQDIFRLCRTEKRSYQEAAGLLGISRDTVKHHMVRSMRMIRESVVNRFDVPVPICLILFQLNMFSSIIYP